MMDVEDEIGFGQNHVSQLRMFGLEKGHNGECRNRGGAVEKAIRAPR